jgi:hypothetical protein
VTDEPQSPSPAPELPVTEVHPAGNAEPPTAEHQTTADETVKLPTQISEPGAKPPVVATAATTPPVTRPPIPPPVPPAVETGPQPEPSPIDKVTALVAERPEVGVGGAFAGGILFALILKRLGR